MRARTAAVLLLALAACSVKLEGASCTGDDNCPGGQKCGYDGKCSNAAAACAEPICRPGSERCGSDGTIVTCEAAPGGICATFKASGGRSCGPGLTCGPNVTCVVACSADAACPAGQKCGYDGRCSIAAAACPGTPAPAKYPPPQSLNCQPSEQYCGDDGTTVSCVADDALCSHFPASGGTSCSLGQVCDLGAGGTYCRSRYYVALSIDAPAAGTLVGTAGVTVTATLTLSADTVPVPASLELRAQGMAVALASPVKTLLAVRYSGTYVPAPADATVSLQVVAAKGTIDEISQSRDVSVDTVPPVLSAVTISCSSPPCLRDSTLTVYATVTDSHPGGLSAAVSLAPSAPIALTGTSGSYSGTFPVKDVAFPYFSRGVTAQVTASDLAGNTTAMAAPAVQVTRLRWATAVESGSSPSLTGAAVDASGKIYVGGSNGKVYKVDPISGAIARWPVATAGIAAAPSIGTAGLWVSGQDVKVYVVDKANGTILNTPCPTVGATQTTAAVGQKGTDPEAGYVGSQNGTSSALYAVRVGDCFRTNLYSSPTLPAAPAIDSSGNVYAAIGTSLHSFQIVNLAGWSFQDNWSPLPTVGAVSAPLAIDETPLVWTAATDGSLKKTTAAGVTASGGTAGTTPDAPVLDAAGNVIVGDGSGILHKSSPSGTALWATPPSLGAATSSALVLSGGDAAYIVPTVAGTVAAVKADGTVLWTGQVTAATGTPLREPNILKLATETFSTAIFGAADGNVYGVIVDGDLDATSPWPKVHHDTRNTGNASAQLP